MKSFICSLVLAALSVAAFAQSRQGQPDPVNMTVPIPIVKVQAKYTDAARAAKLEGRALVQMTVSDYGVPENVSFVRWESLNASPDKDCGLREKAIEAAKQWRFKPATRNGRPAAMPAQIKLTFRLP